MKYLVNVLTIERAAKRVWRWCDVAFAYISCILSCAIVICSVPGVADMRCHIESTDATRKMRCIYILKYIQHFGVFCVYVCVRVRIPLKSGRRHTWYTLEIFPRRVLWHAACECVCPRARKFVLRFSLRVFFSNGIFKWLCKAFSTIYIHPLLFAFNSHCAGRVHFL